MGPATPPLQPCRALTAAPVSRGPLSTGWLSCSGGDGHFFPCGCRTPPSTGNLSGPAVPTYLHSAHIRSHTCTHTNTRTCSHVCPDTRHPTRAQSHPLTCAHTARDILAHVCGRIMTCACTRTAYSHTPVLTYASAHMFSCRHTRTHVHPHMMLPSCTHMGPARPQLWKVKHIPRHVLGTPIPQEGCLSPPVRPIQQLLRTVLPPQLCPTSLFRPVGKLTAGGAPGPGSQHPSA